MLGLSAANATSLLRDASRNKFEAHISASLSLHNACLVLAPRERRGSQFVTLGNDASGPALLLSFKPASRQFATLASVRKAQGDDRESLDQCRTFSIGVVVPFPLGTPAAEGESFSTRDEADTKRSRLLAAALGHAVPSHEAHSSELSREELEAATYVPLLFKGGGRRMHHVRHAAVISQMPAHVAEAWSLSVRALTTQSAHQLAERVRRLYRERCICFHRVVGTGNPFNPLSRRSSQRARWSRVRHAMLQNAHTMVQAMPRAALDTTQAATGDASLAVSSPLHCIPPVVNRSREQLQRAHSLAPLVLLERSTRNNDVGASETAGAPPAHISLYNEGEILSAIARAGMRTCAVSLDRVDHAERMLLLSRTDALVTMGGGWLTHAAFLPAAERTTALVEVYWLPPNTSIVHPDAHTAGLRSLQRGSHDPLARLPGALGITRYSRIAAVWATPESITVDPNAVVDALSVLSHSNRMVRGSEQWLARPAAQQSWHTPTPHHVQPIRSQMTALYDMALTERNVCIAYRMGTGRDAKRRATAGPARNRYPQAQQLISLRHIGNPGDALKVLLAFSEYNLNYFELATMRPVADFAERQQLLSQCAWHRAGFALPFSFNNVYHALYHAVPALEWARLARYSSRNATPHMRVGMDEGVTFVPILHQRLAPQRPSDARRWFAFEFAVRALTSRSATAIAAQTEALLKGCTCFARLEGTFSSFNFNVRSLRLKAKLRHRHAECFLLHPLSTLYRLSRKILDPRGPRFLLSVALFPGLTLDTCLS